MFDAATAERWGLVNKVAADDKVFEESMALARRLADGATAAFGRVKEMILADATLRAQLELESRAISASSVGPEGIEGVGAFLNKRKPQFAKL